MGEVIDSYLLIHTLCSAFLDGPRGPFNGEGSGMLGQGPGDFGVDLSGEVWVETPAEDGRLIKKS